MADRREWQIEMAERRRGRESSGVDGGRRERRKRGWLLERR